MASSKQQQKESIWQSADIDTREILRQLLLSNPWPEQITYDGPACSCNVQDQEPASPSQSTCALISMFCARTILDLEKQLRAREYRSEGRSKEDEASGLLDDILAERTVQVRSTLSDSHRHRLTWTWQRIVSIGQHLKGALRMSPSDLLDVPMFEQVFVSSSRIKESNCYENILGVLE
jgi:plasmid stability protein